MVVFDHHSSESPERPHFVKGEELGRSPATALRPRRCSICCCERDVEIPRLAATIFALGIHEDTGSLTFPRTTIRDAEMLAASMRLGASQALIERYLHSALGEEQREVLMGMVDAVELQRVRGIDIHTVALDVPGYVDGLSVLAHKLMELINAEVLLQAVGMERPRVRDRPVAGRFRGRGRAAPQHRRGRPRPGGLSRGQGRRPRAASSAVSSTASPTAVWVSPPPAEIMSRPVRFIDADTPVTDALWSPLSATGTRVSACARRTGSSASSPGATSTRPCVMAWDTLPSRAS